MKTQVKLKRLGDGDSPTETGRHLAHWSLLEKEILLNGLRKFGRDFYQITKLFEGKRSHAAVVGYCFKLRQQLKAGEIEDETGELLQILETNRNVTPSIRNKISK